MRAYLKNYRQSPRKVRLLVDLIRGKKVADAVEILTFTSKRGALPVKKLLESAIANARQNHGADVDTLVVSKAVVDQGLVMKRWMPRARGSMSPIHKRTSHIAIELSAPAAKVGEKKAASKAKAAKAPAKKAPKKSAK